MWTKRQALQNFPFLFPSFQFCFWLPDFCCRSSGYYCYFQCPSRGPSAQHAGFRREYPQRCSLHCPDQVSVLSSSDRTKHPYNKGTDISVQLCVQLLVLWVIGSPASLSFCPDQPCCAPGIWSRSGVVRRGESTFYGGSLEPSFSSASLGVLIKRGIPRPHPHSSQASPRNLGF